jgi:hypothetical protein
MCEEAMRLKRELMDLRDEIFARPEEEVIVEDGAHITTEGEGQKDSEVHGMRELGI